MSNNNNILDDSDIYDFIYYTYHNWALAPTYVLLVGDVEHIPTHYYQGSTATDHYYSDVDYLPEHDEPYFSEIFVGRISVKNTTELNVIINKSVNYEKSPYTEETDWYKKAVLISDSGYFEVTSNWVYSFLTNEGYTVNKIYRSLGNDNPGNVTTSINDGRAIVNYRGHGAINGWETSNFRNSDVLALDNSRKLPIVISPTCYTGWFDYEPSDCFGETWLKGDSSRFPEVNGGVAFFGSSRVSYGGYNDDLDKGVYKAIFNDGLTNFAEATNRAKIYMYNSKGDTSTTRLEFRLFNNLADPELEIWTEVATPQDTSKFYIKNSSGEAVAWFGNFGNLWLKGNFTSGGTCTAPAGSFIIANSTDETVAYIDNQGNMCIEGDWSELCGSCNPEGDAFIIKNSSDANVSYIDFANGYLCLTGELYQNPE